MATDDSAVRPQRAEETTATTPSWSSAPPVPANPLQSPTCCRPRRPTCSPGSLPSAADVSRASRIHSGSLLFTRRHTGHDTSVMTMFCSGLPGGRVRDRSDRCWRGRSRRRSVVYAAATAHASARLDVLFARRGRCFFSQQHLYWDAGCQLRHGSSVPPCTAHRTGTAVRRTQGPFLRRPAQVSSDRHKHSETRRTPRQARPYPSPIP